MIRIKQKTTYKFKDDTVLDNWYESLEQVPASFRRYYELKQDGFFGPREFIRTGPNEDAPTSTLYALTQSSQKLNVYAFQPAGSKSITISDYQLISK